MVIRVLMPEFDMHRFVSGLSSLCLLSVQNYYLHEKFESAILVPLCSVTRSCPTLGSPMNCNLPDPLSMGFSRQEC